jgi:hypothetical protein
MLGKKDNHDIFNQYKSILLEQAEDESSVLINNIKTSSLDQATKNKLIKLVSAQKAHGIYDADAAGYASYPDAAPAQDLKPKSSLGKPLGSQSKFVGNPELENEPDSEYAKKHAAAQKEQNEKYPERVPAQDDQEPMPTEAPWWVPGEENKQRWLATQQGHWRQAQKEKQEQGQS